MKRYVPLEKQSKKQRRAYHAARRGDWGAVNPVTRTSKNPKAYRRKKSRTWEEDDSTGRDFDLSHFFRFRRDPELTYDGLLSNFRKYTQREKYTSRKDTA